MGYYWFSLIFSVGVVLLVAIVLPWVVIYIILETFRERKTNVNRVKRKKSEMMEDFKSLMKLTGVLLVIALLPAL